MPPILFWEKNIDISKYRDMFKNKWIDISDDEITVIIENMDNIWNLFFDKYMLLTEDHEERK